MRPGKRRLLNPFIEPEFLAERVEKMKASIRAKVEHPFRVIKQQFGFTKVRYRGLMKNTAQIVTLSQIAFCRPSFACRVVRRASFARH
jgi:transposase, IS5 family